MIRIECVDVKFVSERIKFKISGNYWMTAALRERGANKNAVNNANQTGRFLWFIYSHQSEKICFKFIFLLN